ncbi:hypothetical protein B0H19DRAFT_1262088 [Mycena capillaripes]|nr:hypothetical protein B0H19DRAFT_1262088 [Mycena capillaripes]
MRPRPVSRVIATNTFRVRRQLHFVHDDAFLLCATSPSFCALSPPSRARRTFTFLFRADACFYAKASASVCAAHRCSSASCAVLRTPDTAGVAAHATFMRCMARSSLLSLLYPSGGALCALVTSGATEHVTSMRCITCARPFWRCLTRVRHFWRCFMRVLHLHACACCTFMHARYASSSPLARRRSSPHALRVTHVRNSDAMAHVIFMHFVTLARSPLA